MVTLHLLSPFPGMAQAAQEDLQENREQDGVSKKPAINPKVPRERNLKSRNAAKGTTRIAPVHVVSPGAGDTEHHAPNASRTTTAVQTGKKQKGHTTVPRTLKYELESAAFKDTYLAPGQRVYCLFPGKKPRGKGALHQYRAQPF
jgi:hypothetical protein